MKIALGSTSEDKKKILADTLFEFDVCPDIVGVEIDPMITAQPLDERTTIKGASNRAKGALSKIQDCDFSIGLEGGLSLVENNYFLVCAAVIIDKDGGKYVGVSSKLSLPKKVSEEIKQGEQFGQIIRDFEKDNKNDSDILPVISNLIKRDVAFKEAIRNCYQIYKNKKHYQ